MRGPLIAALMLGCAARPLPLPEEHPDLPDADLAAPDLAAPDLAAPADLAAADLAAADLASPDLSNGGDGGFSPPWTLRRMEGMGALAVGDLDGDGLDDVVAAGGDDVAAFLAKSGFREPLFLDTELGGRSLTLGDIDGDGHLDVAGLAEPYAANAAYRVAWAKGLGDGTFGPQQTLASKDNFTDAHLVDVDGDGHLDVVAQLLNSDTKVWPGRGDGTFAAVKTSHYNAQVAGKLAFGDFNGDGKLDAVGTGGAGSFHLLAGRGDGTFALSRGFSGNWYETILSGDVDGDGALDVVLPYSPTSFFRGSGDGDFTLVKRGYDAVWDRGLLADLDSDGRLDLVLPEYGTNGNGRQIALRKGLGNFELDPLFTTRALDGVGDIVAGQLDGDGRLDVAVATGQSLLVISNLAGGFASLVVPQGTPKLMLVDDFDGDGHPDVAGAQFDGVITLFSGRGDGTLALGASVVPAKGANRLVGGDFDEDGRPDLVATSGVGGQVALSDGALGWRLLPATVPLALAVAGDFDGDGHLDLAGCWQAQLFFLHGQGDGSFAAAVPTGRSCQGTAGGAADVDEDGHLDLLLTETRVKNSYQMSELAVLHGAGDGSFVEVGAPVDLGVGWRYAPLEIVDLDGDGHLDVLAPYFHLIDESNTAASVAVLAGAGDGTFQTRLYPLAEHRLWELQTLPADLDGDGWLDVVTSGGIGWLSLLRGGPAGLSAEERFEVGGGWPGLALGDFDGDGAPDIVGSTLRIVGSTPRGLSIWRNQLRR